MTELIPLASWLDENVRDWRTLSPEALDKALRPLWKAGAFQKLRTHTRNAPVEPVLVGTTHFAYVELATRR